MKKIRIATRKSPLALWQTQTVAHQLEKAHPGLKTELIPMVTKGDKLLDSPLAKIGGKGLFVKELEQGMLEGKTDLAVHSMKDVPAVLPQGLHLPVILKREDPRDAFVANQFECFEDLPPTAVIGTCSLRRKCQIKARFPHFTVRNLRGNVNTRLAKLDAGEFDAIILATAGLKRLEMDARIRSIIEPELILPAVGQGAIGVECRQGDAETEALIAVLNDGETTYRVAAERAMNKYLNGGCQVPIGSYAELVDDQLWLRGLVGDPSGETLLFSEARAPVTQAEELGIRVAKDLLSQGAGDILAQVGVSPESDH